MQSNHHYSGVSSAYISIVMNAIGTAVVWIFVTHVEDLGWPANRTTHAVQTGPGSYMTRLSASQSIG